MNNKLHRVVLAISFGIALFAGASAQAADHGDAPAVRLDTRLDINDVYIFQSPTNAANTVIIVTTNPIAGITGPLTYHPEADYEILIDNNADSKEDITFRFDFKKPGPTTVQNFSLFRKQQAGTDGSKVATGQTGTNATLKGGGTVFAGLFDDPFFFDLLAFRNSLAFTSVSPVNFFKGLNTLAIVLEVPSSTLVSTDSTSIGVWARTELNGKQIDRMGRPAINTVLVTSANKDLFNRRKPKDDAFFRADAAATIVALGNTQANADSLVGILFPDIMTFDTASTSGFLNGRKLADDVIDLELQLLTGNQAASDFVGNDSTFSSTFPYLGAKNP